MKPEEKIKFFEKLKEMSNVDSTQAPEYNIGYLEAIKAIHKFVKEMSNE